MAPAMRSRHQIVRAGVLALGVLGDVALGLSLLHDGPAWLLLLHPFVVGLWAYGMWNVPGPDLRGAWRAFLPQRAEPDAGDAATNDISLPSKHLIFTLAALVLFPGVGPLAWSVAGALGTLPSRARPETAAEPGDAPAPNLPADADDPWDALAVQPMVDVLREPDPALRRAAIRILGAQPSRESVRMLSELLVDPDPDVRSEASAMLFRFENQLNSALSAALSRAHEEPEHAEAYAELAACYARFIACDLLDPASAHRYAERAREALVRAVGLAPERPDLWLVLARARRDCGEMTAALAALDRVTALAPDDPEALLLRMEIAFRAQAWAALMAISHTAPPSVAALPAARDVVHWWAERNERAGQPPLAGAVALAAHGGERG